MNELMALIRLQQQVRKGGFKKNYPEKFRKPPRKPPATQSFTDKKLAEVPWLL